MSAFENERKEPSELYNSAYYAVDNRGNAAPTIKPRVVERPGRDAHEAPRPRVNVKVRSQAPLIELAGVFAMLCLVLALIFSNVRFSEVSTDAAELKSQLRVLKEEEKSLRNQYITSLDLNDVEYIATSEYGMAAPDSSQIVYLKLPRQDKAEILSQKSDLAGFLGSISRAFTIVLEYFQ